MIHLITDNLKTIVENTWRNNRDLALASKLKMVYYILETCIGIPDDAPKAAKAMLKTRQKLEEVYFELMQAGY